MRFGGILLAAALVLGGCTGDPAPQEPTKTASSPRPSSTLKPPVMPEQAKEDSPEGAAAFVTHWVAVFNYASLSGDIDSLSVLSASGCEGCSHYLQLIRSTYEAGGYFKGGEWKLDDIQVNEARDVRFVEVDVSWGKSRFRKSKQSDEHVGSADHETLTFELRDGLVQQLGIGSVE